MGGTDDAVRGNEAKRERHRRFWEPLAKGEGAYLGVTSPIGGDKAPYAYERPTSLEDRWLSVSHRVQRAEAEAADRYWGLDAIQCEFVGFGPGVHAAMLGAPYVLKEGTVWFDMGPIIDVWDERAYSLRTDTGHELHRAVEAFTRALCAASGGRYCVSYTDIGGQLDVLFSLRGEGLLSDLRECPDEVLKAEENVSDEFIRYFNSLRDIIGPTGCGHTSWIPLVSDVPWYPLQCDLSVMVSPTDFERFVLPFLDKVSRSIGRAVYHLDGPEEVRHLDMLLSLERVHAIQWVPLPAYRKGYYQDFLDPLSLEVYRRTLKAGKKVVLASVSPVQVPALFAEVGCDGLYVQTGCRTREEADDLIALARREWVRA
ncbi:MAG: hypothetical protein FWE70_04340 [Oscillospiraceae bacterium]|nr:hypothetical protein [Oscillospiraceae bacterium]